MSVKVGVRVRPFNEREKNLKAVCCIEMNGSKTSILDEDGKPRDFSFDYSFWSHDGFNTREDGFMIKTDPKYTDQTDVYNVVSISHILTECSLVKKCLTMHGMAIMSAYLLMGKLDLGNLTV